MIQSGKFCYWSVACGEERRVRMARCVRSARRAGVLAEFHVLTDEPIDDCECYDAMGLEESHGLYKLIYLKAAISKLLFDYFVWVEPDTIFVSNPSNLVSALSRSPIHVPLEVEVSKVPSETKISGISAERYNAIMIKCGILNPTYLNGSAFWIVARGAIDTVCGFATEGWHKARETGAILDVSFALGYAMQLLCGNPAKHTIAARPDLWAADYHGRFTDQLRDTCPWEFQDSTETQRITVRPAIIYVPQLVQILP